VPDSTEILDLVFELDVLSILPLALRAARRETQAFVAGKLVPVPIERRSRLNRQSDNAGFDAFAPFRVGAPTIATSSKSG
jgi:hypothetical protein